MTQTVATASNESTPLPSSTRPLPKVFYRFLLADASSRLGDGMSYAVIPMLAVQATSSNFLISLVSTARTLPVLIFTIFIGILADKHSKTAIMQISHVARCGVFLAIAGALVVDQMSIYLLIPMAFALGFFDTAHDTVAESTTPELVSPEDLDRANGRLATAEHITNNCVGSPLASALLSLGAVVGTLGNGLTFVLAMIFLAPVRTAKATTDRGDRLVKQVSDALKFMKGQHQLTRLMVMSAIWNFVVAGVNAMLAPLVLKEIGAPEWTFGVVLLMYAGGIPAGMLLSKVLSVFGRTNAIRLCYFVYAIVIPLIPAYRSLYVVCAVIAVIGFTSVIFGASWRTYRQSVTPRELLGRVNALVRLVTYGVLPLGSLFAGAVADVVGFSRLYQSLGVVAVGGLALAVFGLRKAEVDRF